MKTLIIYSHTYWQDSKVNKALLELIGDSSILVHNINAIYADYSIDAKAEVELLRAHERIVLQFPLFWYSTPSLLKQWQDVVLSSIYHRDDPKLSGKRVGIITTLGGSKEAYKAYDLGAQSGMERILFPLEQTFKTLKATIDAPLVLYSVDANNLPKAEYLSYLGLS